MLWTLALILLVLWLLGYVVFEVAGALVHLLLVVAAVVIIYRFITRRARV